MRDALAVPLVDAALRGAVVLLVALVLTTLLHRRSAATRHAIWAGAIAAQLLLLGLAMWGPRWRVEAPEVMSALVPAADDGAAVTPSAADAQSPAAGVVTPSASPSEATPPSGNRAVATSMDRGGSSTPAAKTRRAPSIATVLLVLWAIGAAAVLLRIGAGTVIVARLARRGARVDDGGWLSLAQRLATTLRIDRPLTLLRGDRLGVPVTWGIVYPIVLLPEDADAWPDERRRYVLVHEMAHVKRLDALTQLVGQLALAVFWFDPLVWIALRRMQLEREHACDDYVLRHGTPPSRYAEDLLAMVRSLGTPEHRAAQPAFAALAMARRSEFEGRMLSILDPVLDRHPLSRGRTLMSALASLLVIVPLAALQPYRPAAAIAQSSSARVPVSTSSDAKSSSTSDDGVKAARKDAPAAPQLQALDSAPVSHSSRSSSTSNSSSADDSDSCDGFRSGNSRQSQFHMHADDDDRNQTIRYLDYNEQRCLQADIRGKILLPEGEDHIMAMTPAGTARAYVRERTADVDREYTFISSGPPGSIGTGTVLYRVNGVATPYDDVGRRWFANLLPRVLAEAAINVEPRIRRWRSQGGTDAALRGIAELRSSGAKRAHYDALLDHSLAASELERLVRQAGRDVPSSGDLRAVLSKASTQTRQGQIRGAVLDSAIGAVASSGDRTAVLLAFGQTDDRAQLVTVMRVAETIPSSGDKSRLLTELAPRYLGRNDAALRQVFFATAATVPSSGDLARVLGTAVPFAARSSEIALATIEAARVVASSGDRTRVLVALADARAVRTQAVRDAYLRVTREIPSSSDARRALEAIASN
jgi:beta-lactamase regulating signal transducer with metallopeptidase domain